MKVIPIHYEKALPVGNWLAIEKEAKEIAAFIDGKDYGDYKQGIFALHACQVNPKPFNYFVLNEEAVGKEVIESLGSRFIVNPKIINFNTAFLVPMLEGCVSFPWRKQRYVDRYFMVDVEFEVPDQAEKNGLRKVQKNVERVLAQIFQHEIDHGNAINIRYKAPK